MNDKELLERAASSIYKEFGEQMIQGGFNSLESLTDAAELALLLNIDIQDRYRSAIWAGGKKMAWCCEFYTDPASKRLAYCRAVTRAAAQSEEA